MERNILIDEQARVMEHTHLDGRLYRIELQSPRIAAAILPGQFVHMQIPGMPERILRRPFSVLRADASNGVISILYQVVGAGTDVLTRTAPGEMMSLIGPIGNTWSPPPGAHALLVCGGVGAAPLYMLAEKMNAAGEVSVVMGAQTQSALVVYNEYCALENSTIIPATDDGSFGHAGFCTQPAQEAIESGLYDYVAVCGPEPLMKIVANMAHEASLACEVSLERRMACGVGACLSCVVDTSAGKKRCCVDGPIFNASEVVWS